MTALSLRPGWQRPPRATRVPRLVAFAGEHRGGVVSCGKGAWVKLAGTDDERAWDPIRRLVRNLGDGIVVLHGELGVAYAIVTGIHGGAWRETWTVHAIHGEPIADGAVTVMPAFRAAASRRRRAA